jgi:enolase-phosphatase E1
MIKAILTDIEGTTSSLSFMQDVLYPYAHETMRAFIRERADDPAVSKVLEDLRRNLGQELSNDELAAQMQRWIDEDRKVNALSTLQGIIWEHGYAQDRFKGHVYEDALRNLRNWKEQGMGIYGFSAGAVYAQKLLFGHSEYGDVSELFDELFDTNVGAKDDPTAYQSIATSIGYSPSEVLYISDSREELDAARQVGMYTVWVVREGELDSDATHRQVKSFDEIEP